MNTIEFWMWLIDMQFIILVSALLAKRLEQLSCYYVSLSLAVINNHHLNKQQGSNQAEVNTLSMSSILDNIRQIYGSVASELLELSKSFRKLEFEANGYISNANYNLKKMIFLLFINRELTLRIEF